VIIPRNSLPIRLALPKGRMQQGVATLLADAGIHLKLDARDYRPVASFPNLEVKLLKPQNILEMLQLGSRDIGFSGADWVAELGIDLVELLDTSLDPVQLVAAAPSNLLSSNQLSAKHLIVASEYEQICRRWIQEREIDACFAKSYGATEVFPPEDADVIIDNTSTGRTLRANGLEVIEIIMKSSTRLYAQPAVLDDIEKRVVVEQFVTLIRSVLDARKRVMLEVNVTPERLDAVLDLLPCMREPTIAQLAGEGGYAVKAAVPRKQLPDLVTALKACGGTDVVVTSPSQIIP